MVDAKKKYLTGLFFLILILLLFLELVFKLSIIGFVKRENVNRMIIFTLSYSVIIFIIFRLIPRKFFRVFCLSTVIFTSFLYFSQDIYYRILSGFFSFAMAGDAAMGVAFLGRVVKNITWVHSLYLLPVIIAVYFFIRSRKMEIPKRFFFFNKVSDFLEIALIAILLFMTVVHTIPKNTDYYINSPYIYTDYDFYVEIPSAYQTVDKFGVLTYLQRDIMNKFNKTPDEITIIEEIDEYLDSKRIHENNIYTGLFKNKNLILIMAESFDTYAIDKDLTPNLFHMKENSWNFTNYYSPLFFRNTADTEFMSQTGLFTNRNISLSMETYKDNYLPNTLPRIFNNSNYGTYSFHNYTDYFYPRSHFHPHTLGYDEYYGAERLGMLEYERGVITNHDWQSDLDLSIKALDILIEREDPFFSYILTVSGHLPYSKRHPIAQKNIETIKQILTDEEREFPIEDILYYHAANYELDLAIGYIMDKLEAENKAEDTVIMIFGDHYAYGLDQEDIAEYDESKDLESPLSFQRVPMIIYNPSLYPRDKDEVFASIDIMPTIANLFDLKLDYKRVLGKDIFSNQRRSIFFSNGSILTDDFLYDLESEQYTFFNDNLTEEEAIVLVNEYIYSQKINQSILDIDYYRIKDRLEENQ